MDDIGGKGGDGRGYTRCAMRCGEREWRDDSRTIKLNVQRTRVDTAGVFTRVVKSATLEFSAKDITREMGRGVEIHAR